LFKTNYVFYHESLDETAGETSCVKLSNLVRRETVVKQWWNGRRGRKRSMSLGNLHRFASRRICSFSSCGELRCHAPWEIGPNLSIELKSRHPRIWRI